MTPGTAHRVSVGIPVYNGENYLAEALRCAQLQEYEPLDILVSDNSSTDRTEEICREFARTDHRITYVRHETNRGGTWNYNFLAHAAKGDLFCWLPADNLMRDGFVDRCVEAIQESGGRAVLAYPRGQFIDEHSEVLETRQDNGLRLDSPLPHVRLYDFLSSGAEHVIYGLIRTDVLRRIGGVPPVVGCGWVLGAEFCLRGPLVPVDEPLIVQRRRLMDRHVDSATMQRLLTRFVYPDAGRLRIQFGFTLTRLNLLLYQTVLRAHLPREEQARCLRAVFSAWTTPRWKGALAADVFTAAGSTWPPAWRRQRV